ADRGVRPGGGTPGARPRQPGGGGAPGAVADGAPAVAATPGRADLLGGGGRDRVAAPGRRRRSDAGPAGSADRHRGQDAERAAAGAPVPRRRARRGGRRLHHPGFPHQELPDLVYIEQLTSALYLEKRDDVEYYFDAVNRLYVDAAPLARTVEILERIARET